MQSICRKRPVGCLYSPWCFFRIDPLIRKKHHGVFYFPSGGSKKVLLIPLFFNRLLPDGASGNIKEVCFTLWVIAHYVSNAPLRFSFFSRPTPLPVKNGFLAEWKYHSDKKTIFYFPVEEKMLSLRQSFIFLKILMSHRILFLFLLFS